MRVTHIHAYTDAHTGTHAHRHRQVHTKAYTQQSYLGPRTLPAMHAREDHLPDPPLAHLNKPAGSPTFSIIHLLGTWPNPDLPGLQSQPRLVECQAPGQLSSQQGGGRQAGRPQRQCVSQRAARGPSWRAACSHTWLNRDNGGCFFSSASFPQAGLQVLEAPEHPQSPADNRASWESANRPCRDFPGAARPVSWPLYRERGWVLHPSGRGAEGWNQ